MYLQWLRQNFKLIQSKVPTRVIEAIDLHNVHNLERTLDILSLISPDWTSLKNYVSAIADTWSKIFVEISSHEGKQTN